MSIEKKENDPLRALMKESLVKLPFSDFEARTMLRIRLEASAGRDRKRAHLFFVLGMIAGLLIGIILSNVRESVAGISPDMIRLGGQAAVALLVLLLGRSILPGVKKHKS